MWWNIKCELQKGLLKSRRSPLSHHNTEARQSAGRWASRLAWSPRKYYTASGPATSLTPSCFPRGFITKEMPVRCINRHHCMKGCRCTWSTPTESADVKTKYSPKILSKQCVLSRLRMGMTMSPEVKEAFPFLMTWMRLHSASGKRWAIHSIMQIRLLKCHTLCKVSFFLASFTNKNIKTSVKQ